MRIIHLILFVSFIHSTNTSPLPSCPSKKPNDDVLQNYLRSTDNAVRTAELAVRTLYELQPYPPRLHNKWLSGHSVLIECLPQTIQQALGQDLTKYTTDHPYRILIAGAGTGDPTLSCAHSFFLANIPIEVIHLDLSARSTTIAIGRVQRLLTPELIEKISFVRGSINDIAALLAMSTNDSSIIEEHPTNSNSTVTLLDTNNPLHVQQIQLLFKYGFNYIHSTGVLHHTFDPTTNLFHLQNTFLKTNGGLALWMYSSMGRAGIHDIQKMMSMLLPKHVNDTLDEQLAWENQDKEALHRIKVRHANKLHMVYELLENLPETSRLSRNPVLKRTINGWVQQHKNEMRQKRQQKFNKKGKEKEYPSRWDVRISDMFLNPIDKEYSILDFVQYLKSVELHPVKWLDVETGHYDTSILLETSSGLMHGRLDTLTENKRLEFGELFRGTAVGHRVIAAKTLHSREIPVGTEKLPILKRKKEHVVDVLNQYSYIRI